MTKKQPWYPFAAVGLLMAAALIFIALQLPNIHLAILAGILFGANMALWLLGKLLS